MQTDKDIVKDLLSRAGIDYSTRNGCVIAAGFSEFNFDGADRLASVDSQAESEEPDYDDCPNCHETYHKIQKALQAVDEALSTLED